MAKDFKVSIEIDIPESVAVSALLGFYKAGLRDQELSKMKRPEITEPETIELQRELRDLVKKEAS